MRARKGQPGDHTVFVPPCGVTLLPTARNVEAVFKNPIDHSWINNEDAVAYYCN